MRRLALLSVLYCAVPVGSMAITAGIYVDVYPTCNYPSGRLQAQGSGGVGPYTYLWSTGATTAVLDAIPPGEYSVTVTDFNSDQATANYSLQGQPYGLIDLGDSGPQGLCSMGITGVTLEAPGYSQLSNVFMGEAPYTLNGELMEEFVIYEWGTPMDTIYTWSASTQAFGTYVTYPFEDAQGCTGTVSEYIGYPVEWPTLTVLDIQGACSSGNNGSVTFQTGLEGHGQATQVKLQTSGGQYLTSFPAGDQIATNSYTLAPGDYLLTQFMSESTFLVSSGCQLSTAFTIPDLGDDCGNISGTVFMDNNENCTWQGGEPGVPGVVVEVQPGPFYALTTDGHFGLNLPMGSFTLDQQSAVLDAHCTSGPVPFTLAVGSALQTLNVADTALVPLDAAVAMASGPARPGFELSCTALVSDLTLASTGTSTLTVNFDPLLTFISANPAPTVTGNTLTWTIAPFSAFQARSFHIRLQVPPDITLLGTDLLFDAAVNTGNTDADLSNNSCTFTTTVTGSYDPNDKLATTSSRSSDELYYIDLDNWIDYTIRFQNTGNDTAFNVVVTDTIPADLDLATFTAGASSHPYALSIRDGNVLRWAFYNIQLPDSNVNEPGSHGYVSFRIKPRLPVLPGATLENIANIFFDFNPPVITEPSVLLAEFSTGLEASQEDGILVHPNPTAGLFRVSAPFATSRAYRVFAADGREVRMPGTWSNDQLILDASHLEAGLYVVHVGGRMARIVKQ